MSYALTKFLTQLIYPFNLALIGITIGVVLMMLKRYRTRRCDAAEAHDGIGAEGIGSGNRQAGSASAQGSCAVTKVSKIWRLLASGPLWLALSLAWLWVWSTPALCTWLAGSLERRYPPVAVEALPSAELIVVLGGCMGAAVPPRLYPELNDASSRLWHGARLYRAGKAPLMVVTSPTNETAAMKEFLVDLGVPAAAIIREMRSRTTYENALFTRELILKERTHALEGRSAVPSAAAAGQHTVEATSRSALPRIILVTSAQHMARAEMIFKRVGFEVIPAATCYQVLGETEQNPLVRWLPDGGALGGSSAAFKEYVGYWVYLHRKVEGQLPARGG